MNEIVNQLAQSLFKKNSLQECSRWELEILAEHYPYFGIAQFLITGKLKEEKAASFNQQLAKTSLYFTNPLWLDYVINNKDNPPATFEAVPAADVKAPSASAPEELVVSTGELKQQTEELSLPHIQFPEPEINGSHPEPVTPSNNLTELFPPVPVESESVQETAEIAETADELPPIAAEEETGELKMKPLRFAALHENNLNSPLVFEPYHTVDYFASQGIKMTVQEKPKDRFDQQLKSFTQWLKTIKKLPVAEIVKDAAAESEEKVISLAAHSVEHREIVTEAMAEVWLKQENKEKATEVYRKLSLQNPAKSAYFASLIEKIK